MYQIRRPPPPACTSRSRSGLLSDNEWRRPSRLRIHSATIATHSTSESTVAALQRMWRSRLIAPYPTVLPVNNTDGQLMLHGLPGGEPFAACTHSSPFRLCPFFY